MSKLYVRALRFRKRKAIIKKVADSLMFWPFFISCLVIPPVYMNLVNTPFNNLTRTKWGFLSLALTAACILLALLVVSIANFITKLEVKIGRTLRMIIRFALILIPHVYLFYTFSNGLDWFHTCLTWLCLITAILFDFVMLMFFFRELAPDAYFYSQKIHLTDELILESIYGLCNTNDWQTIARKRNKRNEKLDEIERLAGLIEVDWNSHVLPKDLKNERWRNVTTRGIANGIRKLKRELMFPGKDSHQVLATRFSELFLHTLNHDLQGFLQEDVPALRIRKKSFSKMIQQFLVALLPIGIGLGLCKYFSQYVPQEYQGLLVLVGIGWFIICLLLWLDPQLADKMMVVKQGKNLINPLSKSDD
jgi:hypothetical protein